MKKTITAFLLLLCPVWALAAEGPHSAKALMDKLAGVYKYQFENGFIDGTKYTSENIFEFVPVSEDAAYVKVALKFYNGHSCDMAGIAVYDHADGFLFQDPETQNPCKLTFHFKDEKITASEPESGSDCQKFCGARGHMSSLEFSLNQKRKIRYMPLILNSEEYKESLEWYKQSTSKK